MEINSTTEKVIEIADQKIELKGATLLHLNEIRRWTGFLSILGFIAMGLLLIAGIIMLFASSFASPNVYSPIGQLGPWIGIVYILVAVIYFFPVLYMYRFSSNTGHALIQLQSGGNPHELMATGIDNLKKHFRFVGIFTILILVLYLIVIIGALVLGLTRGGSML